MYHYNDDQTDFIADYADEMYDLTDFEPVIADHIEMSDRALDLLATELQALEVRS